ncbi:calcium channel protein [Umbelopsis sp. WA50703]
MESIDAENARGDLGSKRRLDRPIPPRLQIQIPHPIPQITYSKPADETSQEQGHTQIELSAGSATSNNDNSLTPPRSPYRSLSSPTSPLPLTRDILSKKDKLEKSLDRAEHHNRRQGERLGSGLDIKEWQRTAHYHQHNRSPSGGSAVEPVSAGGSLTIPSPNDASHFFLRSPISPQILNFGYENIYRHPEPSARNSSQSGSSINVNRWSSFMSSKSAHTGSSIADDNLSAEAFDPATHYYTKRDEQLRQLSAERRFHSRLDVQRSRRSRLKHQKSAESSNYIWNILTSVASRVVLSKSCESPEAQLLNKENPSAAASTDWLLLTGDDAYLASQHLERQEKQRNLKPKDSHSLVSPNARHSQSTDRRFSIFRHSDSALERDKQDDNLANHTTSITSSPRIPDFPKTSSSIKQSESLKVSSIQDYPNYDHGAYKVADNESVAAEIEDAIETTDNYNLPSPLQGYSLFIFSPNNRIRLALWRLMRSKAMELFIFLLIFAQWILLASNPIYDNADKITFGASNVHYAILAIQCIYSLEIIAKIIVYGFIIKTPSNKSATNVDEKPRWTIPLGTSLLASVLGKCLYYCSFGFLIPQSNNSIPSTTNIPTQPSSIPPSPLTGKISESAFPIYANAPTPALNSAYHVERHRSYLSNFGNWLDLISVICYWIDLILMKVGYTKISMFKGFGAARPLRLVGIIPGYNEIAGGKLGAAV